MLMERCWVAVLFAGWVAPCLPCAQTHRLNATLRQTPLTGSVAQMEVSADGTRVVFSGDPEVAGEARLWSAPVDHSAPTLQLESLPLLPSLPFALAGSRAVYVAGSIVAGELYSVPIDGSSAPIALHPGRSIAEFLLSPDGTRAVYRTPGVGGLVELFSVSVDGSAAPVELMDSLASCTEVYVNPSSTHVIARWVGGGDLFRAQSIDGSGPVATLATAVSWAEATVQFSPDGTRFFFAVPEVAQFGSTYLHSVPVDGSAPPVLIVRELTMYLNTWRVFDDGQKVLVSSAGGLSIYPATGGAPLSLPPLNGVSFMSWTVFSPDESTILFSAAPGIGRVATDGLSPASLVNGPWINSQEPVFTSDGGTLVVPAENGLFAVPTDWSSPAVTLASTLPGLDSTPSAVLLPDQTQVLFMADVLEDGASQARPELYLADLDGGSPALRLDAATGQGVVDFALADNSARAVYLDQEGFDFFPPTRCVGVPLDLSEPAQLYHSERGYGAPTLGDVWSFQSAANGDIVVFAADHGPEPSIDLYRARPFDPRGPLRLSQDFAYGEGVSSIQLSPDGSRVVYWTFGSELWSVTTDGLSDPVLLDARDYSSGFPKLVFSSNGEYVHYSIPGGRIACVRADGSAAPVERGPDGMGGVPALDESTQLVYFTGVKGGTRRIYSMPADGGTTALQIVSGPATMDVLAPVAQDGLLYYLADPVDGVEELFVVPLDGSSPALRISAPLVTGGEVSSFAVRAGVVVYRADGTLDERFDLYRSTGVATSVALATMPSFGDVELDVALSPDGTRAFYRADSTTNGRIDLCAVAADGASAPITLATPSNTRDVQHFKIAADGSRLVFGQQGTAALPVVELWSVPADGSAGARLVHSTALTYALSPDDELAFSTQSTGAPRLVLAQKASGRLKTLGTLHGQDVSTLLPLANERVLWLGTGLESLTNELFLSFTAVHGYEAAASSGAPGDGGTVVR